MITIHVGRLLGTLRTEQSAAAESEAAGSRGRTDYRPVSTPVLNDGKWHYWMAPGEDYRIGHDGTGWRVTCRSWVGDHTYRLATAAWEFTDRLPLDDDRAVTLEPGTAYELRHTDAYGVWTLHAV